MKNGPKFDFKGRCYLETKQGSRVILTRKVWDEHLTNHPERAYYQYNFDSIKMALLKPDERRRSKKMREAIHWYKAVERVWITPENSIPRKGYWCVVVRNNNTVMTVYLTDKMKAGEKI